MLSVKVIRGDIWKCGRNLGNPLWLSVFEPGTLEPSAIFRSIHRLSPSAINGLKTRMNSFSLNANHLCCRGQSSLIVGSAFLVTATLQ